MITLSHETRVSLDIETVLLKYSDTPLPGLVPGTLNGYYCQGKPRTVRGGTGEEFLGSP